MSKPYIHPSAIIEKNVTIGENTRVWAFVHILPEVVIGNDCNICDHVFIENGVRIGNNATIKSGIYLWTGVTLEDNVFLGPNVVFTNDKKPRSKKYSDEFLKTLVRKGASIGANATILPDLTIGRYAMIGAGTVVTKIVPDFGLILGNPGKLEGWVCHCGNRLNFTHDFSECDCGETFTLLENEYIKERTE